MTDKHTEAFLQEAAELLEVLESSLIELEARPDDEELVGQIFRALHTIKGSGGMFGFENVAEFVHDIETVYDRIRNSEIKVDNEIIDLTLKACDKIKQMLRNIPEDSDPVSSSGLLSAFRNFLGKSGKPDITVPIIKPVKPDKSDKIVYKIVFTPAENLFLKGTKTEGLLKELSELGEAVVLPVIDKIPVLSQIDPEKLYTSWVIFLSTVHGIDSIKDVFIFVEDDCRIEIEEIDHGNLRSGTEYYAQLVNQPSAGTSITENKATAKSNGKLKESKKNNPENISNIRVNSDKLDLLVNLVGELVTVQARLTQSAAKKNDSEFIQIAEIVERLTWELRETALNIRMLPIGSTFNKFNRLVRDLSKELGKEVELITEGGETELDKNVIERLNDPFVHIIRNCIDHGIENPELRVQKGKASKGRINLSAIHSGTHVLLKIEDDGAGLNKEAILKKAVERGLISAETKLTDKEIFGLIFQAGFSTANEVTNVSGRGVGLDVVRSSIEALRGSIELESKKDSGTIITLKLPLTLAIIEGLIIRVDEEHFVIPLSYIEECLEFTSGNTGTGRQLINVRGEIVPYIPLRKVFNIYNNQPDIQQVVILNNNGVKTGLLVDEIIGQHQTVIKSLGKYYKSVEILSGATVLGNGTIALIIDIPKLVEKEVEEEEFLLR